MAPEAEPSLELARRVLPPALLLLSSAPAVPPVAVAIDTLAVLEAFQSDDPDRVRKALADLRRARPVPLEWLLANRRHPNRGSVTGRLNDTTADSGKAREQ